MPDGVQGAGGVWAVRTVRDEADVIETVMGNLLAQGVERVLIADNFSTDDEALHAAWARTGGDPHHRLGVVDPHTRPRRGPRPAPTSHARPLTLAADARRRARHRATLGTPTSPTAATMARTMPAVKAAGR